MAIHSIGASSASNTNKYSTHLALMRQANNAKTAMPQSTIQTAAKCPHGFPGGGCPICSGKMGGGGGAADDKKKNVGLMSWNEASSVFNMLQKLKLLNIQDQKDLENTRLMNILVEKMEKNVLYQRLAAITNAVTSQLTALKTVLFQAGRNITATVLKAVNTIVNAVNTSITKLIGVVNKLTAVMGEKIRALRENIQENMKKIMAKLNEVLKLNMFFQVFNDKRHLFHEFLMRKVESLKEKIQKFTDILQALTRDKQGKKKKKRKKEIKNRKKGND